MTLNRELEQLISNALYGKNTEDLDLPQASKFVDISEKLLSPLEKYITEKEPKEKKPLFRFKMSYYYKDKTGYYYDTGERTPIAIVAENKVEALQLLLKILPAHNGNPNFTLRYTMRSIEQVEDNE